jgi:hypothetical protein
VKTLFSCLAVLLMLAAVSFAAPKERTFSGEIMDSACAKAGSHDAMMKKAGLKTAKECTEACVKNGSKYVLFNKATKKTYELDDQTKPQQFAGDKVKVKVRWIPLPTRFMSWISRRQMRPNPKSRHQGRNQRSTSGCLLSWYRLGPASLAPVGF